MMKRTSFDIVILIPGLLCDAATFRHQVTTLANLRIPYYVPPVDRHNNITNLANYIVQNSLEQISSSSSVSTTTLPRLAICGFSYGGYIALELARLYPQYINRLNLLCSQAREDSPSHTERRLTQIESAKQYGNLSQVMIQQCKLLLHPSQVPPNYEEMITQYFNSTDQNFPYSIDPSYEAFRTFVEMGHRIGVPGFIQQQQSIMNRKNNVSVLESLSILPTVQALSFIRGSNDILIPRKVHTALVGLCTTTQEKKKLGNPSSMIALSLPTIYETEIKDCGHMAPMEKPNDVTQALLEWLNIQ